MTSHQGFIRISLETSQVSSDEVVQWGQVRGYWRYNTGEISSLFLGRGWGLCSVLSMKLENPVLRAKPSQLAILSNVLILHQLRDGWACYSHILAGLWLAATCHPCWMWLLHPGPCVESLTPIGSLPRWPRRDPYMINLTDSWLPEQRHPPEDKGLHASCCTGLKSQRCWDSPRLDSACLHIRTWHGCTLVVPSISLQWLPRAW